MPNKITPPQAGRTRRASTTGQSSRRTFLATAGSGLAASVVASGFPSIVPSSVLGAASPSNRINVGAIGTGRISRGHDLPGIMRHDIARVVAACDLDKKRVEDAKVLIEKAYTEKAGQPYTGVKTYTDYRELLANPDIDAVVISTPDHQHAILAIEAARAGKDIYLQKPASLTISEGRAVADAVHRSGRIFQIGSQQRSTIQFRYAAELVRNGRIGELKTVEVGLPGDPAGGDPTPVPVPAGLDYDAWLGSTPVVPYADRPRASAERLRASRLAALRAVRRRHDHRLGRAPHRQRALGHGHRVHRPGRDLGHGGVPDPGPVERARRVPHRGALRQRRAHDRQRRLPERDQVHRHQGLDLRLARQRDR